MAYVRGSRHDFDQWATEGCTGWSYKDVLPYFLKMEDSQIPSHRNSRTYNISVLCYLEQKILYFYIERFFKRTLSQLFILTMSVLFEGGLPYFLKMEDSQILSHYNSRVYVSVVLFRRVEFPVRVRVIMEKIT